MQFRGKHGNFYFAWKPSQVLLTDGFKYFVGEKASKIYSQADAESKDKILAAIKNLKTHRNTLKPFFKPERGNVRLDSESTAPLSTEGTSSEESSAYDSDVSEEPGDSSSGEE